ncbi:MAG: helix-turn-helix domain-containing protein [bacterium]|nr:helix-turn-helix domain-containing protein [bacterium]
MQSRTDGADSGSDVRTSPLLQRLAGRVRGLRHDRQWTRDELSRRSGLSVRFLARVESGDGNISIVRLESLARALGTNPSDLLRPGNETKRMIALVGLRGAGKSTVGPLLSQRLDIPFLEMDTLIMEDSGLPLDQIFELHGERYYRRLEQETLRRVLEDGKPVVLAAAGGVVNEPASWDLLRSAATVVWLRARPEDHWSRVIAQGDRRPMANNPAAMDELRAMLAAREATYAQAGITVDTTGCTPEEVAAAIADRYGHLT